MTINKLECGVSTGSQLVDSVNGLIDLAPMQSPAVTELILNDDITSPLDIDGLALWHDVATCAVNSDYEIPADGGSVTQLLDASGNARHSTLQSGSATFELTGGYGGMPAIRLGTNSRFQSPEFVDSSYGTSLTTFIVTKAPESLHSSLRLKLSISSTSFFQGNVGTTRTRDYTMAGLTGYNVINDSVQSVDGIDYVSVSPTRVRVSSNGEGRFGSCSNTVDYDDITGGSIPFSSGRVITGGLDGASAYDWQGTISEVMLFSRTLTDTEIRQVRRYLTGKYDTETVVLLGNSLTSGEGSTSGEAQYLLSTGDNYPCQFLLANPQYNVRTDAFPGRSSQSIYDDCPSYSGVSYDSDKTITVVWEGTNTLATTGSAVVAYEYLKKICLQKARSYRVVIATVLYRNDIDEVKNRGLTDQLNALIRDNYTEFATDLLDLSADVRLSDPSDLTYFFTDEIHLNSVGYGVVSELLTNQIG